MPNYDRNSGKPYRPGVVFQPPNAAKLLDLCDAVNLSITCFLDELIEWLPVDPDTGRPVGWPKTPQQEALERKAG